MRFIKVHSPTREAHAKVSQVLSTSGASVSSSNSSALTHTLNSKPSEDLVGRLEALGAALEIHNAN